MIAGDNKLSERERRLGELIFACLNAPRDSQTVGVQEVMAHHPEFAAELAQFFAFRERLDRLATPLRDVVQAAATAGALHEQMLAENDTADAFAGQSFGQYELLGQIGRGGMGVVYKTRHKNLNRLVALKMIRLCGPGREPEIQRFRQEAETIALLDHPHIVPIYEVGEHNGQPFFSMKLIEGGNLADVVLTHPESSKEGCRRAAEWVATVAKAVHHAHQRGVLHRDLKPSNVLLDRNGQPHVTDFGLSRRLVGAETQRDESGLTEPGQIVGTPSYMAPEQAGGKRGVTTTATDVHGLGAILYALLTGRPPFRGETVLDTLTQVKERDPEPPSKSNKCVDRDLETICLKCLEKEPHRRYGSAEALAEDLERYLADEPVEACPPTTGYKLRKFARKNKKLLATVAAFAALLLLGIAVSVWQAVRATQAGAVAVRERNEASLQRDHARQKAEEIRQHLYVANMAQCFRAWQVHDHEGMRAFLDRQQPGPEEEDLRGFEWGLLHRLYRITPHAERSLGGHIWEVYCVAFAPDGTSLASAGMDGKVHFWDPATGQRRSRSLDHADEVNWIAYSPSGKLLATACDHGRARVWDVATARALVELKGHGDEEVECAAFSPDGNVLATCARDNTVNLWSVGSYQLKKTLPRESAGHFAAFAPDGSTLCTGSNAGLITLWDPQSFSPRQLFRAGGRAVLTVQYSHDSRVLAASGNDGVIRRWETRTGQSLPDLVHGAAVQSIAFSPNDAALASAGDDAVVRIWDLAANAEQTTLRGHRNRVWSVAYSPDGKWLASSSYDQIVKLWQPSRFIEKDRLSISVRLPNDVRFSSDGQILATCNDGEIECWDPKTGKSTGRVPKSFGRVKCFASSPTQPLLALFREEGTPQLWNLKTNQPDRPLEGPAHSATGAVFSPDGTRLAAALDRGIGVWSLATGRRESFFATSRPGCRPAFAPDSRLLAGVYEQGVIALWNLTTGARGSTLRSEPVGSIDSIAFSPDGSLLAVSLGPTVKLWDITEGVVRNTLACDERMGRIALVFTPDGRTLAAGGGRENTAGYKNGKVILWSVATGQEILDLDMETSPICALTSSSDGSALVAAGGWDSPSQPSKLLIWRADTSDAAKPRGD
jgi:WD40 repeat protein/tRNA A-37 threonylcarbamoyl transferase component Bud32